MKKILGLALTLMLVLASALPLVACDLIGEIGNNSGGNKTEEFTYGQDYINKNLAGDYWIIYSITRYENGDSESITAEVRRTSKGYYYAYDDFEMLFIKNGNGYDWYYGYDGDFQPWGTATEDEATMHMGMGLGYMNAYSSYGSSMERSGSETVAGRDCAKYVYNYNYPFAAYKYKYTYCIDKKTGVCLKVTIEVQGQGQKAGYEFLCTKFQTSGVSLPSPD